MSLNIRKAVLTDYLKVNELVKEVHQLHVSQRPDVYVEIDTPLEIAYFEQLVSDANTTVWVVEDQQKRLVAYSVLKMMKPLSLRILKPTQIAFIDDFCVTTTHQKQGIGKQLFEHIKCQAKNRGATSLQLVVWEFNKEALLFYEALGMQTRNRRLELTL